MSGGVDVMHVITDLDTGGAENMLTTMLLHKANPESAVVVSLKRRGRFALKLMEAGYQVYDLSMDRNIQFLFAIFKLAYYIRKYRPKVIQGWMYHADIISLFALYLSGLKYKTKLFWGVRCSNMELDQYHLQLRLIIRLCIYFSNKPNGVIANSEAGRAVHISMGYKPKQFSVIVNGVDTKRFSPNDHIRRGMRKKYDISQDAKVILLVARLDPMKGYEDFTQALTMLTDVVAVVAGEGTLDMPYSPSLIRLGRVDDIENIYPLADIFVSSSRFGEGFPNVIVEAMASGLPVVSTDVGDSAKIIKDIGIVVPPSDPEMLMKGIDEILSLNYKSLGDDSRERVVKHYSIQSMCDRFDHEYKNG